MHYKSEGIRRISLISKRRLYFRKGLLSYKTAAIRINQVHQLGKLNSFSALAFVLYRTIPRPPGFQPRGREFDS